ncbi:MULTISPECIES: multidrug transporter [Streptomyces]|uniref:Multidrug transporter n=1 Tax=Streptomyces sanglieri TaxID=193460 RepID=A0ABW2WW56_9ACTN|nr:MULTISPECIES: multidrug transporter [unclassified Streptomyces]MCX4865346.1 multidrug transporter [Streptomyces sp. NBC_00906]MCX4896584.1 multidrug transporter [Streptomyces sp. NBC_00892]
MTPATRSRPALLRRLRMLTLLEAANIALIGWAVFAALGAPFSTANAVGFALVAGLLLIGSGYWALKVRQLRTGARQPPAIGVFRPLRPLCALALAAGLAVMVPALPGRPPSEWAPGLVLYGLGLAEYVNYFHRQLMHDTAADWRRLLRTRRLRRSHLAEDLRAHRGRHVRT